MIKTITILSRASTLSQEEFARAWTGKHADLVRKVPGIERYVQNLVDPKADVTPRGIDRGPIDGVAEFWYQDQSTMESSRASPEWELVVEDSKNLVASVTPIVVTELTIVESGE